MIQTYRCRIRVLLIALLMAAGSGCQKPAEPPQYARPLAPGESALRKLPPHMWPSLEASMFTADAGLLRALERSQGWFEKPSTRQFFGGSISHEHAHASVFAMHELISSSQSPQTTVNTIREQFDLYQSVGWDGRGTVLYTGYYTPQVEASRQRTDEYRFPLYRRPSDLVSDKVTGRVLGRRVGQAVVGYPSRREIETSGMLRGQELVWMRDPFECYLVQIQGSARLEMADGSILPVGFAGSNGHEYVSIAKLLVAEGKLDQNTLSLPAVQAYFDTNPGQLSRYIMKNDRFVFFKEYEGMDWPAGSLGVSVTARRSLATDKSVYPRGGVVLVETEIPMRATASKRPFRQIMLDQDTGGAIRAAGRADIYMGIGPGAKTLAGRQLDEGKLYHFFLRSEYVAEWVGKMKRGQLAFVGVRD